jgi:predicted CoA-substrate-specific enzyme activase
MITAGVDLGSTYVKAAVVRDGVCIGTGTLPTGFDHDESSRKVLDKAMQKAGVTLEDLEYIVSTGYGRRITTLAQENISEISANAAGTRHIARTLGVRTIVDIGGQDTKVISLDEDLKVANFAMNDKCAAGTGRFLETLSRVLNVPLTYMGPLSLKSRKRVDVTTTCLVFAKSEVAALVTEGHDVEDIIAGIHRAIAKRLGMMVKKVGLQEKVFFDGGPARNVGMRAALEEELGVKLVVPDNPQTVTATGAAMVAAERLKRRREKGEVVPRPATTQTAPAPPRAVPAAASPITPQAVSPTAAPASPPTALPVRR